MKIFELVEMIMMLLNILDFDDFLLFKGKLNYIYK